LARRVGLLLTSDASTAEAFAAPRQASFFSLVEGLKF
jgi:hypothetical protein